ncbi:MFS transporter [Sphingosinicella sp. CPCC 101087]|uniref:MFS transporter n=1 Tax=Sphingosinicella sp. CPCC 101087 TaxID=2497754 RepID=UPI00101C515D|nr:MFS transporter [Sphingosinicella sp. CPCC 101087]
MANAYRSNARVLTASLVGTSVEFYDFYIYATAAALVFGPLFFPAESASAQLLAAYASLGVAFIARPIGAAVFGHFGDRIGRKSTLVASLMLMGGSTLLIAFLPTYETAGWVAPLLLCILRFGQGLGLGGEWGGAALLAVENAPPGHRARFGMFPQLGAPIGFLAANGLFLLLDGLLTETQFVAWGWRIPFLLSIVLVAVGLWVRLKLSETPAFAAALEEAPPPRVPLGELFARHAGPTIAGMFAVIACFAVFYLSTAFALGHGTTALGIDRDAFLQAQLVAALFFAFAILLAGWASDASSAKSVLIGGCGLAAIVGLLMAPLFDSGSIALIWLYLILSQFTAGILYGPLGTYLPDLFPARVRYSGASISFNVGGIMGGALAPIAAQALVTQGGLFYVGLYLAGAAAISATAMALLRSRPALA